ncbi:hypothetical protein VNO77_36890 [Canavalia gladiata]|uniref:Uncharacterized protein n=1 Tax=Canavalia gladiata TaxID=3824 RepID=A0AAN9PUJ2_CANGL
MDWRMSYSANLSRRNYIGRVASEHGDYVDKGWIVRICLSWSTVAVSGNVATPSRGTREVPRSENERVSICASRTSFDFMEHEVFENKLKISREKKLGLNCNTNGGDFARASGLSRHGDLREAREASCGKLDKK